ncbi:hypothetical protein [Xenorhabdus griffiniae]|uniref:Phage protein n=1 Tax=Xenorhabdus griffiniae TaxID=351672 RepID=A0ABY9XL11_9GAMM|nr:hypothetical protein [Xenorhabdus griffiniae]MBD1229417.1 hypothetical protein [Xenorhabdus griffiniae]MBE8589198.1 hypothetical protein [Xenorhabdus griffiniae]WMV73579.1 hypothetical protein QL128_06035 [Xenorhabdus griffiniae]WMV73615.1 hypothetical protein QL128_06235 [Xenorhabdus griffiniae]WNH03259.1 hypothetical protein QL112_006040 [Xenorhabdus griffiniae]
MHWQRKVMQLSPDLSGIHCAIVPVHPFAYGIGQQTDSGSYLSPANAIDTLANKLTGAGNINSLVLMVCAKTHNEFMQHLTQFASVLPLPVFAQVKRMAKTAESLAITKMQLPGKQGGGLPLPQPLSTATSRLTANSQLIEQAKAQASAGSSVAGLKSQLTAFTTARQSALQQMREAINGLKGKSADVWAFSGKGNGAHVAEKLRQNIPEPDAVYTLAILFAGDAIRPLERMLHHEPNYHPRP